MTVYMLDTNICSFIIRKHAPAVRTQLERASRRRDSIVISSITYFELQAGALKKGVSPHLLPAIAEFLARLNDVLPFDARAADHSARLRSLLHSAGTPIGPNDTMIAGHALATNAVLVTNNVREFSRVAGLTIEDWVA